MERLSRVISVVHEANFKEHLWKSGSRKFLGSGFDYLWIKWVVGDINLTFCHIDPLRQKSDVSLVVNLCKGKPLEPPTKLRSSDFDKTRHISADED